MDINEKYFGYGSTMSFIIFNHIENNLHILIDNKLSSTYLKSASLSKSLSNLDLVSLYYSKTNYLIIFDILKGCTKNICQVDNEVLYHDYNVNNYLLILFENGVLGLIKNTSQLIVDIIPNFQKVVIFRWYPYSNLDNNIFCFCTSDNDVYMVNLNSEKNYETKIGLNGSIKEYKNNKITELQWYLSDSNYKYILIGFDSSDICLCDMNPENATIITKFERTGKNLNKLIWIKNEPGVFYSFYKSSAKISIFNASSPNPKKITKITDKNISNCLLLTLGNENKLLISLTDGEVIIYDLDHKKTEKELTQGHSGTIFDLKFSPFIKGLMATSSIDGMIKLWDIYNPEKNVTNLKSSTFGIIKDEDLPQIICIKWSPNEENKNLILSGDSKNMIKIWDINNKKIISKLDLLENNKRINNNNIDNNIKIPFINKNYEVNKYYNVVGLDWNEENTILATCNTSIFIINYTGNKLILTDTIDVHTKLCKIEFSPYPEEKSNQTFAVACGDGKIRIYEISKLKHGTNISPTQILSGHTDLIFGLSYKPYKNLKEYFLASGSDDYRIGIWSWARPQTPIQKKKFLYGHTDKVRNVAWFKQENFLISGSWDGLAFIWDINHYICLSIINKHKSDVYGIDTNYINPYLFATSSRDCSICIFNYDFNQIGHILLYKYDLEDKNNLKIKDKHPKLFEKLKNLDKNDKISKAEIISEYFLSYPCLKELFDILRIIYHKSEHNIDNNKIFHISDLYSAFKSNILKTEFELNENGFKDNNINKNKLINDAIMKSATINDWEKFCELNILINNWEKALMFAPKVSKKYWENLVIRYNKHLTEEKNDDDDIVLYKLLESSITKDVKDSLDVLEKRKEYNNCLLLFVRNIINKNEKIKEENNDDLIFIQEMNEEEKINNLINQINNDKNGENYTELMKIINLSTKDKLSENKTIEAVCIFLSVNQITLAIKLLISLAQYELAFYLMDISQDYLYEDIIYINLIKQSIKMNNYISYVQLIQLCHNKKLKMILYKYLLNQKIHLESKEQNEYNELIIDFKKNKDKDNEIDIFLNLCDNVEKYLPEIIDKYYTILLKELYDEKLKVETLLELNELFNVLRIYDINIESKNNKKANTKKKILLILIILETLNNNCTSLKLLINEFLKISNIKNINELDENEKMIINIGNYYYKSINNQSLLNINFNLNLSLKKNINFKKLREEFNKEIKASKNKNLDILNRFSCDLYNKFFLYESETKNNILEVNKYIQIINEIPIQ